jgi:RHS repeat-associated protein
MPVDVTTGEVRDIATEFRIDGRRGLVWNRYYCSRRTDDDGLGRGHRHLFQWTLRLDVDGIRVETPQDPIFFKHLWADGKATTSHGWELVRISRGEYSLRRHGEPTRLFVRDAVTSREFVLARLEHTDGGITVLRHRGCELLSVQDSEGWHLTLTWRGGLLRSIAAAGSFPPFTAIAYTYDEPARLLLGGRDAYGHTFAWAYDDAGRVARRTDRRGYAFDYAWDGKGRCVRTAGEDGVDAIALEYADSGRETKVVHETNGATWWYRYGPDGAMFEIEDPYGACRQFIHADDGTKLGEYDGEGHEWKYELDRRGAKTALRDPLGHLHPPDTDPAKVRRHPLAHRLARTALQQEHGNQLALGFDVGEAATLRQLVSSSVAEVLVPAEYAGVTRDVKDPQGLRVRTERRFAGSAFVHARRFAYDANGNVRTIVDLDRAKWSCEYASWNHRVRIHDPMGGETRQSYGGRDKLASVTDPGGTETRYRWDLRDRLSEVFRHGALRDRYVYDAAGGLIEKRGGDGDPLVSYVRGPLGVLQSRKTWDGVAETFERDDRGRILLATNRDADGSARTLQRAYDRAGRTTLEACDGGSFEHAWVGARRARTTLRIANSAFVVQYGRGADGSIRVVDPTGRVHEMRRIGSGIHERRFANGTSEIAQYDGKGRCLAKVSCGRRGSWRRRFLRSGEGDLLRRDDDRRGRTDYRYDAAHRLTEVEHEAGPVETYEHDAAGNVLRKPGLREWAPATLGPPDLRHDRRVSMAPGNRLWRANGDPFAYDRRDHVCKRGDRVFAYDGLGRLRRVVEGAVLLWEADYDALGRRTHKRCYADDQSVETWSYVWDGDRLGAETLPDGRLRIYVYADEGALVPILALEYASSDAAPESGRVFVLQSDHRGAIERVEDEQGEIVWEATIQPYGEVEVTRGDAFHQPFCLVGQYADPKIGLAYQRYRYWSSELARFVQSDPLGLAGGPNVYAWPGCPLLTSDPLGLGCRVDDDDVFASLREGEVDAEDTPRAPWRDQLGDDAPELDALGLREGHEIGASEYPYERCGWRKDIKDDIRELGRGPDGVVRSPSGTEILSSDPVDVGHKESFDSLRRRADAEAWDRPEFIDANNDRGNVRPELPSENRSGLWQPADPGDLEFGPERPPALQPDQVDHQPHDHPDYDADAQD